MDKYDYKLKTEQMLELMENGAYNKAAEVADTIDWKRVRNATILTNVSDIYERNGDYQKSYEILNIAYHRAEGSRKVLYRLCALAIKTGNVDEAIDYYDDFMQVAPKDPNQHILKYKILSARKAPIDERIDALEEFKKAEYIEEWAYELAKLYQEAGMTAECLEECDDLILWFSEGKYVYKAMELKMQYKPLTPSQQERYDHRYEKLESATEEIPDTIEYQLKKAAQDEAPERQSMDPPMGKRKQKGGIEQAATEELPILEGLEGMDDVEEQSIYDIDDLEDIDDVDGLEGIDDVDGLEGVSGAEGLDGFENPEGTEVPVGFEVPDMTEESEEPLELDETVQKLTEKGIGKAMKLGDALKSLLQPKQERSVQQEHVLKSLLQSRSVQQEQEDADMEEEMPELAAAIEEIESVSDLELVNEINGKSKKERIHFDSDLEELKAEPLVGTEEETEAEDFEDVSDVLLGEIEDIPTENMDNQDSDIHEGDEESAELPAGNGEEFRDITDEALVELGELDEIEAEGLPTEEPAEESAEELQEEEPAEELAEPEKDVRELPENIAEELEEESAEELPEDMAEELEEESAEELPEDIAEELEEESAEELPENIAEELEEESAEESPEDMAEELEEESAEELPEDMAEELEEESAGESPEDMAEELEEEGAGELPEDIAEELEEESAEGLQLEESVEPEESAEELRVGSVNSVEDFEEPVAAEAGVDTAVRASVEDDTDESDKIEDILAGLENLSEEAEADEHYEDEGIEEAELAKNMKPKGRKPADGHIEGQLSIEELLRDIEKESAEEVEMEEKKKKAEPILPPDIQRLIDEIEGVLPEDAEPQTIRPGRRTADESHVGIGDITQQLKTDDIAEYLLAEEQQEEQYEDGPDEFINDLPEDVEEHGDGESDEEEYADESVDGQEADEYPDAPEADESVDEYEDIDYEAGYEADGFEDDEYADEEYEDGSEDVEYADEPEDDEYEDEPEDDEYEDEYEDDEYEDEPEDDEYEDEYEDDEYTDEYEDGEYEDEYEDDEYTDEYEDDEYEDEYEDGEYEDEYEDDEYTDEYEDDEYEDGSEDDEYVDEYEEGGYEESDEYPSEEYAEYDDEEYDAANGYEEEDYDGIEASFEEEFRPNTEHVKELDDREIPDDDNGMDILSATTPLSRKETAKLIATGKTAPLPMDEISNALSMSDTGFVVHGRYDLAAQSGIGTRAGLTDEQKKLFSYFVPVRGMSEQLVDVLEQDLNCTNRGGTSRTGNLLIIGNKGNGKTVLAVDVVKAIQKQRNIRQGKVAIVTGDSLNRKKISDIFDKLFGGALIIEKAAKMNEKTVARLNKAMERNTGEIMVVLEEQRKPLDRLLSSNREFRRKFTSRLEVPIFINDELVTFGQTYAQENGYRIDEMGILALYSRIDALQREDHAVTVAEVKEVMDEAMEHSQKASAKKLVKRVFGKNTDDADRIILSEKDFNI